MKSFTFQSYCHGNSIIAMTKKFPKNAFQFFAPAAISMPVDKAESAERKLTGVAYSGEMVTDHGYWSRLIIDLDSVSVNIPVPLLSSHDHDDTIGMVTSASTQSSNLAIEARLFADVDDEAARIAAKADKGFPWQLSVGIWPASIEEVKPGTELKINNRSFQGPFTVFRGGRVREISVCAVGADSRTSATVLSGNDDFIDIPVLTYKSNAMKLDEALARIAELEGELTQLKAQNVELSAKAPDPAQFVPVSDMLALQAQLATLSATVQADNLNKLIEPALADGRLLPNQKDWAESLGKSDLSALKTYLETAQPIAALQGTQTGGKAPGHVGSHEFKAASGYSVEPEQLELHAKILDYQKTHNTTYEAALLAVGAN